MKYDVTLNGKVYEVIVERGDAILVSVNDAVAAPVPVAAPVAATPVAAPTPAPTASLSGGEPITSPLPGTIVKVNVKPGDTVKSGQPLLILEAMKMENEITAPRDGKILQIVVDKGAKVDTGSPLLSLE